MTHSRKKYPAAEYVPTGEVTPLLAVLPEQYGGPWTCREPGCDFLLDYRSSSSRHVKGRRVDFSSYWARNKRENNSHVFGCAAQKTEGASKVYWSKRLGQEVARSQTVLLSLGNQHEPPPSAEDGSVRAEGGEPWEYAGRAGTLAQLLRMFINAGGHEGMQQYFYNHSGAQYRWQEIAYGSSTSAYQRLARTRAMLHHNSDLRPWVIGGTIGRAGFEAVNGKRLGTHIYPSNEFGGATSTSQVSFFCDNTSEAKAALTSLRPGTRVVVLLQALQLKKRFHGGSGDLTALEHIFPIDGLRFNDGELIEF